MTSGTTQTLNAVWVESQTVAWAAGTNGTVLQLATSTWSRETTNSTQILNGVWSGDNVVYTVGANSEVLRRVGSTWARVTVPSAELLYGVHGNSATDVVIVGANGTLLRWNGTTWSVLSVGGLAGNLYQVSGSAANGGRRYVVGDGGVAQLDGTTATLVNTPYAPQLFGVSVDATGTAWTSGERGAVLRSADAGGAAWTTNNLAPDLLDVWTTATNNAFAVGEFGFVYRWNGTTWTRQQTPTVATLQTVWAVGANDAFAGGDNRRERVAARAGLHAVRLPAFLPRYDGGGGGLLRVRGAGRRDAALERGDLEPYRVSEHQHGLRPVGDHRDQRLRDHDLRRDFSVQRDRVDAEFCGQQPALVDLRRLGE